MAHCYFPLTETGPTVFVLTVMSMKSVTIGVRWGRPPQDHISLNHDKAKCWHMSRWTSQTLDKGDLHLTVICAQVDCVDIADYIQDTLRVMKCLWVDPKFNSMKLKALDDMLVNKPLLFRHHNKYSVMYTDISPGYSFYNHLIETKSLVSMQNWSRVRDPIVADDKTSFKLCCTHTSHSVTVIVPGSDTLGGATQMMHVHCDEPQRIYDLMKKHNLACSNIWDSTVALSARHPCTALVDYSMKIVNVNIISQGDPFGEEPRLSTFYHNLKHKRLATRHNILNHHPYILPGQGMFLKSVPVALYYTDPMTSLNDVIKEDGRFVPCVGYHDTASGVVDGDAISMIEVEDTMILMGPSGDLEEVEEEEQQGTSFPCFCCYNAGEVLLSCGHVCCSNCQRVLEDLLSPCGVCREPLISYKKVHIPEGFQFTCNTCCKSKDWVTDCGHLICAAHNTKCPVCNGLITNLQRVFK